MGYQALGTTRSNNEMDLPGVDANGGVNRMEEGRNAPRDSDPVAGSKILSKGLCLPLPGTFLGMGDFSPP